MRRNISSKFIQEMSYQQVSVLHRGSEQTATEDFMNNNETRAIRVNVCTTIEELEGRLEAIKLLNPMKGWLRALKYIMCSVILSL